MGLRRVRTRRPSRTQRKVERGKQMKVPELPLNEMRINE
jgi:hypothetical protein